MIHVQPFATGDFQPARVEPELPQDRGVDVRDVTPVVGRVEAQLVGGTVLHAAFHAAAGQPRAERLRMMITAGTLGAR